jgi:hypothetical protein
MKQFGKWNSEDEFQIVFKQVRILCMRVSGCFEKDLKHSTRKEMLNNILFKIPQK